MFETRSRQYSSQLRVRVIPLLLLNRVARKVCCRRCPIRLFLSCLGTWCSSARISNISLFKYFSLQCFCYVTRLTRMSLVFLTHIMQETWKSTLECKFGHDEKLNSHFALEHRSACKKFVCTVSNWRSPNEVVVYAPRVSSDAAALLLHSTSICHVAWDPTRPRLAICCANDYNVYFWTPEGVSWFEIPAKKKKKEDTKRRFGGISSKKEKGGIVKLMWIRDDDDKTRLVALLSNGLICGVGGLWSCDDT